MSAGFAILIPAAGAARRMRGRDKLLEPVAGGVPLLGERVAAARATGLPVLVALPPQAQARWTCAKDAQIIEVAPENGMGGSIAALVRALPPDIDGAMILPADMPDISPDDMRAVLAGFAPEQVVRGASADGQPGHPVLFPRRFFARLARLSGDDGARAVLRGARVRLVPLPAEHALTDLDTPEDWARWRARQA